MLANGQKLRIAIDSMGGDYAPSQIVKGAILAASKTDAEIILVGPEAILTSELSKYNASNLAITRVSAEDFIREGESPAFAVHRKLNATINVAMDLVKSGKADAVISAGPTGAVATSAMKTLGLLPGIERPVICAPLVGLAPKTILVDSGANIDCKPHHLLSFAIIGAVYAKKILNISNPKIALLSVGVEAGKGTKSIKEAYILLKSSGLNFVGNIEGYDILAEKANVIVCDGIVGNVLMKFYESLGHYFTKWLRNQITNVPLAGSVMKILDQVKLFSRITRKERDGGGLLWGVKGMVHLLHGNSQAKQIVQAIARTTKFVNLDLIDYLETELALMNSDRIPGYSMPLNESQAITMKL
jgi:phosphate acyltransferase